MSRVTTGAAPQTQVFRRVLGVHDSGVTGPTLVCIGGIHGNEPAGVHALLGVLGELEESGAPIRGRVIALAGNLTALKAGQRFVDRDLNRAWADVNVNSLMDQDHAQDCVEDAEQREILEVLDRIRREARGPVVFLDLHTSSAPGASFVCMSDTLANRSVAMALPVPIILGLEECIDGTIMEYFNRHRMVAVAVEGGRERDGGTIENLQSAVWITLLATGMLPADKVDRATHEQRLRESARGAPRVLEIRYRQHIDAGADFLMEPGFESFDTVEKGRLLARCDGRSLFAPEDCRVLLPLYQGQGDDGYFLARRVGMFWLSVAAVLRRCRLQSLVHWIPGVRRHPAQ